jgi:hypothetical protein
MLSRIRRQLVALAQKRHRADLAALFDYAASVRVTRARAVSRAIKLLPSLPIPEPLIGDDIAQWIEPRAVQGIKTLAALTVRIPRRRRWRVTVPGLGATGARKIETFFALHPQLTERARALVAVAQPQDRTSCRGSASPSRTRLMGRAARSARRAQVARIVRHQGCLPQGGRAADMNELELTRENFAKRIGASWDTFKRWLLPLGVLSGFVAQIKR